MRSNLAVCLVLVASCTSGDATHATQSELIELPAAAGVDAWRGLAKPARIHAGFDHRVYVADNGDSKIKVFDTTGVALDAIGGAGRGPGEFGAIQDFALPAGRVLVFDAAARRFVTLSADGKPVSVSKAGNETQVMGMLGDDRIILASNALWSTPVPAGRKAWPLAEILSVNGDRLYEIGERPVPKNMFTSHIEHFVLPAGTRDGRFVWLAYINSPDVIVYRVADSTSRRVVRQLPFEWKRLADDFKPSPPKPGSPPAPPFDVVSVSVATDSAGRVFILTATGPTGPGNVPASLAVDVLSPDTTQSPVRYPVPGPASDIAVSPDGRRVYLLNEPTGAIRTFRIP